VNINIDIESIIAKVVESALSEERLLPIITANVEGAIKRVIDEQFGYRAPFSQLLTTKMAEAMPTDFEDLGRFGDLVLKTIKEQMAAHQDQVLAQIINDRLSKMLKPLPASMKLSELVAKFTEEFSENRRGDSDGPTFIVEDGGGDVWYLHADPKQGVSRYSCKIMLRFRGDRCWAAEINETDMSKKKYIGPIFDDEALAFNLYTNQIRIERDEVDLEDFHYNSDAD